MSVSTSIVLWFDLAFITVLNVHGMVPMGSVLAASFLIAYSWLGVLTVRQLQLVYALSCLFLFDLSFVLAYASSLFYFSDEYVICIGCKSPDTILSKENRLFFLRCEKVTVINQASYQFADFSSWSIRYSCLYL